MEVSISATVLACLLPTMSLSECFIWSFEDTSNAAQRKAMVFAAADYGSSDEYVGQGFAIAQDLARAHRLDYVSVFMTRTQDGQVRSTHSALSAAAVVSFNPGNTPIDGGRPLLAKAMENPQNVELRSNLLLGDRKDLDADQVREAFRNSEGTIDSRCD